VLNPASLIAIMLGRLEMDVDQCITAYSLLPFNFKGKVKSRFDSAKLGAAVLKMINQSRASNTSERDLFNDGVKRGCRT